MSLEPSSSLPVPLISNADRYRTLAEAFSKTCSDFSTPPAAPEKAKSISSAAAPEKAKPVSPEILCKQYAELETAYAAAAASLKGRTEELSQLTAEHYKTQTLFTRFFSPSAEVAQSPVEGIRGIANGGNNCAFNAILQMIVHSEALRESLMAIPEFTSLRRATARYFNQEPGAIDSQQIRLMLNNVFGDVISTNPRFEDAFEALGLMLSRVPPAIAARRFSPAREIRTYAPTGATRPIVGRVDRSRLDAHNTTTTNPEFHTITTLDLHRGIDPRDRTGRVRLQEADFDAMLTRALDIRSMDAPDGSIGENGWFLGEDPTLLYEHRLTRRRVVFDTMPNQLILAPLRYRNGGIADDTPMQMPRVLTLPAEALAEPAGVDRRLVLKSFIVFRPGHYVAYVKMGDQWFFCNDGRTPVAMTIEEIDDALHRYPSGGSYLHLYERGDADAEPALTPRHHAEEEQEEVSSRAAIATLEQLQKLASDEGTSNEDLLKLFDQLPKEVRVTLYGRIWDKATTGDDRRIHGIGRILLRSNVRLVIEHNLLGKLIKNLTPKIKPSSVPATEVALQLCDAITKANAPAAKELFQKLGKEHQALACELVWTAAGKVEGVTSEEYGKPAILHDPITCLGTEIAHKDKVLRIADHLVNSILDAEKAASELGKKSKKAVTPTKTQTAIVLELSEAIGKGKEAAKEQLLTLFGQLQSKHRKFASKLVWKAQKPKGDVPHFGRIAIQSDPLCLQAKVNYQGKNLTIIEHLVNTVLEDVPDASPKGDVDWDAIIGSLSKKGSSGPGAAELDDEYDPETFSLGHYQLGGSRAFGRSSGESARSVGRGMGSNPYGSGGGRPSSWLSAILGNMDISSHDHKGAGYDHKGKPL